MFAICFMLDINTVREKCDKTFSFIRNNEYEKEKTAGEGE